MNVAHTARCSREPFAWAQRRRRRRTGADRAVGPEGEDPARRARSRRRRDRQGLGPV